MKKIVNDIIDLIKDNKNNLVKLKKEDDEIFAFDFQINQFIEEISKYKNKMIQKKEAKEIFISHYGNPYITAVLCMEAILHQTEMMIEIEEICYGLNKAIVKIVNDVLQENKIHMQISLQMNTNKEAIEKANFDKLICLGNSNAYTNLKKIKNISVEYVPLFDMVVYYDSLEYEELAENIRIFATQNLYEIEIFDETEDFEDVIYSINHSLPKYCAVILSKDQTKQNKFKQQIKSQIICINENPFKQFELKIPNQIFNT